MKRIIATLGLLVAAWPTAGQAQEIDWQVVDRYRLFDEAVQARPDIERLLERLKAEPGAPVDLEPHYRAILTTLQIPDLRSSHWDQTNRIHRPNYARPGVYRVRARVENAPQGEACDWIIDGAVHTTGVSCAAWIEFDVVAEQDSGDYIGAATAVARMRSGPALETPIRIEHDFYVALGDSFISGEGNPESPAVLPVTPPDASFRYAKWGVSPALAEVAAPAQWWDEPCHRSLLSFPVTTTLYLAAQAPHRATTLVHLGCSGAEVRSGLVEPQQNLPGSGEDETSTQLEQLALILGPEHGRPRIDRVLLSIGGNDTGFADVVQTLVAPPNGWRFPLMPWIAGVTGDTVCPYDREAQPLARLCGGRLTAQSRLDGTGVSSLREEYELVRTELREQVGIEGRMIVQTQYPDILRYRGETGALEFCRTALNGRDIASLEDTEDQVLEAAYARDYPGRVRAGFEALNGVVPWYARMRTRPFFFQFQFNPERSLAADVSYPGEATTGCDMAAEPDDSEVCQAYWVWARINREVRSNSRYDWKIVGGHVAKTGEHGWCVTKPGATLALPLARDGPNGLEWDQPISAFEPYDRELGRWFRTANDSLRTQYAAPDRFHQGSVHPTFHAHLAFAEAVLTEAFLAQPE